jgi:hypothetical protein
MNNDFNKQAYFAALSEASSELEQISTEIAQLTLRRSRIEKAVDVLKGQIDFDFSAGTTLVMKKARRPGLYVQTRVRLKDEEVKAAN